MKPIDFTPLNYNILLVEDNKTNQILTKTRLEMWNCKVDIAENGIEAIEKTQNNLYNVVLMDVEMPVMNGCDATKIIRNNISTAVSKIPIIGMSGHDSIDEIKKMKDAGMDDCIIKPFKTEAFYNILLKYALKQL
ncbi:response regulator [Lutibacter sp. HS1-25]|uniref:response regulator n=1 Tax=Lutibacter sp. HS1-25 TaxID=2485000 RepID=UPI001010922D|nr:response regulator [Lutibacter sp. HS1-25]RXP64621.1 response regulator [Lutibacter sp. HS1-25]